MDKNEILKNAKVQEDQWDQSYITDDGQIYTPIYEKDQLTCTGKEVHLNQQNAPPHPPTPTTEERLAASEKQVLDLQAQLEATQTAVDALLFGI